jgi:hypothetical protein
MLKGQFNEHFEELISPNSGNVDKREVYHYISLYDLDGQRTPQHSSTMQLESFTSLWTIQVAQALNSLLSDKHVG